MFCRFLELFLGIVANAGSTTGIIATSITVRRSDQRKWRHAHANGIIRRRFPEARTPESPGFPAQERPEGAVPPTGPRGTPVAYAASHDPGPRGHRRSGEPFRSYGGGHRTRRRGQPGGADQPLRFPGGSRGLGRRYPDSWGVFRGRGLHHGRRRKLEFPPERHQPNDSRRPGDRPGRRLRQQGQRIRDGFAARPRHPQRQSGPCRRR